MRGDGGWPASDRSESARSATDRVLAERR